jgi:hypothetical protein
MTPAMTSLFVFIGPPLVVCVVGVAFTSQTEDEARIYVSVGGLLSGRATKASLDRSTACALTRRRRLRRALGRLTGGRGGDRQPYPSA